MRIGKKARAIATNHRPFVPMRETTNLQDVCNDDDRHAAGGSSERNGVRPRLCNNGAVPRDGLGPNHDLRTRAGRHELRNVT